MKHTVSIMLALLGYLSFQGPPAYAAMLFFGSNNTDRIGRIETATGNVTTFPGIGNAASVSALTFDGSGRLWGNTSVGVGEFDTNTGSFSVLVDPATVPDPSGATPGFSVLSLVAGGGGLFFGDQDRIGRIDVPTGDVTLFPYLGLMTDVRSLTFDTSGRLWGVTNAGVGEFDTTAGGFSLLVDPTTIVDPDSQMPGFSVSSLASDAGDLFFGDQDRIGRIDLSTGDVTFFPHLGLMGEVNALGFDASGRLWGNVTGTGVGEFDTTTGSFSLLVDPATTIDPNTGMPGLPVDVLAVSSVPEPSSMVLLSSTTIALLWLSRRAGWT